MQDSPQSTRSVSPSQSGFFGTISSQVYDISTDSNNERDPSSWEPFSPPPLTAASPPDQNSGIHSDGGRNPSGWGPFSPPTWAAASPSAGTKTTRSNDETQEVVASSPGEGPSRLNDVTEPSISDSSSHRSSLSARALPDNDPNKHDDILPKNKERSYRLSERYLEYRAQLQQDTGKDGEPIWSDDIEDALHQALEAIPPGISHGRNDRIAEYICKATGQTKMAKQVLAYLRSLNSILKGDPDWDSLMSEPPADRPNRGITDSRNSSTIDVDDSWVPVDRLGRLCLNKVKGLDFHMMVMAPHHHSRRYGAHTITRTLRHQNHQLPPLTSLGYRRWQPLFPYLKSALDDSKDGLATEVLLIESDMEMTNFLAPSVSSSTIELKLDLNYPILSESLTCRTIFCRNGHRIFESRHILLQQPSTEVRLPFESTWWAKYIARVIGRNQRLHLSGAQRAVGEVLIDDLSAVQELRATPAYTSGSSLGDAESNNIMAILLWRFKQIQSEEPGTTTWRKVHCVSDGSKVKVSEHLPRIHDHLPIPIHGSGCQGENVHSSQYSFENRERSPSALRSHLTHMDDSDPTNGSSILRRLSSYEAVTDSGYASTVANRMEFQPEHLSNLKCFSHETSSASLINAPALAPPDDTVFICNMDERDEVESIYSDTSSVSNMTKGYIDELANDLVHVVEPYKENDDALRHVFEALPELLRAFALTLGHSSSGRMQRDMMVFIYRHRMKIAAIIKDRISETDPDSRARQAQDNMTLDDKMDLWQQKDEPFEHMLSPGPHDGTEEQYNDDTLPTILEEEDNLPGLATYRDIIHNSPTYTGLLDSIRRECMFTPAKPDIIGKIRRSILNSLPISPRISRQRPAEIFDVSFKLPWDPRRFLIEQEYTENPEEAIEQVITLTGSTESVQALTCGDYMRRTWPSTGTYVLKLLKVLVSGATQGSINLPGDTRLCFSCYPSRGQSTSFDLWIDARGISPVIAEIGEQLAWLVSALRSSQPQDIISYSRPFIGNMQLGHVTYEDTPSVAYICEIGVEVREGEVGAGSVNGECWLNLFAMPLVVEGFPIQRRPEQHSKGLEIPLTMIAALAGARRVCNFEEKTVLKGFSTMLIPTNCSLDIVTWHLVCEKDESRISYCETERFTKLNTTFQQLEASRHIVGWCPEILFCAGESNGSYDIKNSGLSRPSEPNSILSGATLSAGHVVTGGAPFNVGRKDIRMRRNPYIKKIRWISQQYVTFWDVGEKRGWLVNGASALLHLVRASIAQDQHDSRFSSLCPFNDYELQEASQTNQSDSALEVLLNPGNFKVKVYAEDDEHICFKDRVEDFYDVLERMIDYQTKALGAGGKVCQQPRSILDGWDFTDIMMERDPIYPRQAILSHEGRSWVDLTRTIHAVTLFGRGFGEVIYPRDICCPLWAKVPLGMSYLAVSVADLNAIMEAHGDPYSTPTRLTHEITFCVDESLSQCLCQGDAGEHVDITQVLLPSGMRHELSSKNPMCLERNGAVVFGHNSSNHWFWGDTGHPSKAPSKDKRPSMRMELSANFSDDSGIGRSVSLSTPDPSDNPGQLEPTQSVEEDDDHEETREHENNQHASEDQSSSKSELSVRDFQVAIMCALSTELMAVRSLFDSTYKKLPIADGDPNYYALGCMEGHNIVAVCLPRGTYGTNPAASVASNMRRSFPALRFCLLVGIGAGVPSPENDIRLGDVVVSTPSGKYSGVLPYDMLKTLECGASQLNGYLCPPPGNLMGAINELESDPTQSPTPLFAYLHQTVQLKSQYTCPGAAHDRLFMSHYSHASSHDNCDQCNPEYEIQRSPRPSTHPEIHYGLIASGNQIMRSAETRDRLSKEHNVLCFEMEGAGIMNNFPCLVIRGICDYADSHKNKQWQNYAAATAASYAKLLLSRVRTPAVDSAVDIRGSCSPYYPPLERKRPPSPGATSPQDQRPAKRTDRF